MADDSKTTSAKDKIEAAKASAEDAETVDEAPKTGTDQTQDAEAAMERVEDAPDADTDVDTDAEKAAEASDEAQDAADDAAPGDDQADQRAEGEDDPTKQHDDGDEVQAEEAAPEPEPEPAPVEEPAEESGAPISAVILKYLVILIVGGAAALWAGPRIAPNLPGWAAPVAAFLTPGVDKAAQSVAAAEAAMDEKLAAIAARVDEAEAVARAATEAAEGAVAASEEQASDTAAAVAARIEELAAEPRADVSRLSEVAERLAAAEAALAGLRAEFDGLAGFSGSDTPSGEMLERVAAFGAAVEGLRTEMAALSGAAAQIEGKADSALVDELAQRVAALENGEAATTGAREAATTIRRDAAIDAALTRIGQALVSGASFADALTSAEDLTGVVPPEGLAAVAGGAPTQDTLLRGFPLAAQEGYAAALVEEAGEGMVSTVFAKLQGRLGGRPATETQGDGPGAVLSRVEARLNEGRLADARAEAEGLPPASQAAMGAWLGALDQAIAAAAGLTEFAQALRTN